MIVRLQHDVAFQLDNKKHRPDVPGPMPRTLQHSRSADP